MNILMFNYEYPPIGGGGGVAHQTIAEELARTHQVCVITSAYADLPRHQVLNGVEVLRVAVVGRNDAAVATHASMLSYPPAAWWQAFRLLRRRRFDVVNSHFAVPTGPGSLPVAVAARIPHVLSLHGGDIYDPSKRLSPHRVPLLKTVVRSVIRRSQAVTANSRNTVENVRRYYGLQTPIRVIPLGIRRPEVPPARRTELGLPGGYLAVTVGRLIPRKALGVLLEALAHPECGEVRLAVVGSGPELSALRNQAATLGLVDRVVFAGQVDEIRKWQILRAADAYVSSSMHEGFGLVYLEALAAGLPIVTPDSGGHTEFLRDGVNVLLTPVGDPAALASAIGRLATQPSLAARLREANLRLAAAYDASRCAQAFEQVFVEALEGKRDQPNGPPRP